MEFEFEVTVSATSVFLYSVISGRTIKTYLFLSTVCNRLNLVFLFHGFNVHLEKCKTLPAINTPFQNILLNQYFFNTFLF